MHLRPLTGKTRHRAQTIDGEIVLVLQVEYSVDTSPVRGWRDAKVEDLASPQVSLAGCASPPPPPPRRWGWPSDV